MADLIEQLLEKPYKFNFFQAVSLLEEKCSKGARRDAIDTGKIRFEPDTSIVFPPNDIAGFFADEDRMHFICSFMGLSGSSSPLPVYFLEFMALYSGVNEGLHNFLTIFNHRIYALFYRAWKKYQFMHSFSRYGDDPFTRCIGAIAGLRIDTPIPSENLRYLAYSSLLNSGTRGAASLQAFLSHYFDGIPVKIQEFVPRWAPLRNCTKIGVDMQLGVNTIVGTSIFDISGKFRVIIGPLQREEYETFLPGTQNISVVKRLVERYLSDPLDFDIEVQLQRINLIPVVLGDKAARIGETASLGSSTEKSDIHSVRIES